MKFEKPKLSFYLRTRLGQKERDALNEMIVDYEVDESELVRRMIMHVYKKRPVLGGESLVPGKTNALVLEAA